MKNIFGWLLLTGILCACHSTKVTTMTNTSSNNALSGDEKKEGWQLLFDGASTAGWHTYGKQTMGKAWKI